MKRKICVVGILVFSFFVVSMMAAIPAGAQEQVKIMGTVIHKGNEEVGNFTSAIQTESGEYDVSFTGKGKDLQMMFNKKIEATGYVKEKGGQRMITITDYRVLE